LATSYRLSSEERQLQTTLREFAERDLGPRVTEAERAGTFPRAHP
jgi:hypothetical protein